MDWFSGTWEDMSDSLTEHTLRRRRIVAVLVDDMKASLTDTMSNNKVQIDACSFARTTSAFQNRLHEEGRECLSGHTGFCGQVD